MSFFCNKIQHWTSIELGGSFSSNDLSSKYWWFYIVNLHCDRFSCDTAQNQAFEVVVYSLVFSQLHYNVRNLFKNKSLYKSVIGRHSLYIYTQVLRSCTKAKHAKWCLSKGDNRAFRFDWVWHLTFCLFCFMLADL